MPSVLPNRLVPSVVCQPPAFSAATSCGMCRSEERISDHAIAAVSFGPPPRRGPPPAETTMPRSVHASRSMCAVPPVWQISFRFGSRSISERGNQVRCCVSTTASQSLIFSTSRSTSRSGSLNVTTW
jgi:hypothetical protein